MIVPINDVLSRIDEVLRDNKRIEWFYIWWHMLFAMQDNLADGEYKKIIWDYTIQCEIEP